MPHRRIPSNPFNISALSLDKEGQGKLNLGLGTIAVAIICLLFILNVGS